MRPLFVLLGIILISAAGCSEPTRPTVSGNSVSLTFASVDEQQATLILINSTDAPVSYLGFGQAHPLKTVEVLTDTGWSAILWDWCGTGAETQLVQPHSSVEIIAPVIRRNVTTRVTFGIIQQPDEAYRILTSNVFFVP
jgi:hypothetical protein